MYIKYKLEINMPLGQCTPVGSSHLHLFGSTNSGVTVQFNAVRIIIAVSELKLTLRTKIK
jgi:hypothetical protein